MTRSAPTPPPSPPAVGSGRGGRVKTSPPSPPDSRASQDFSPQAAETLDEAGRSLWKALSAGAELTGGAGVLALEACRCVDRLERLHRALTDKAAWLELDVADGSDVATVVVDKALAEARQQQMTLKQLLTALGADKPEAKTGGSFLDDLAARRVARDADAASSHSP